MAYAGGGAATSPVASASASAHVAAGAATAVASVPAIRASLPSAAITPGGKASVGVAGMSYAELVSRQTGRLSHAAHRAAVSRRATLGLAVSGAKALVAQTNSAITCMDVDNVERRYLLAGAMNGSIRLFDTRRAVNAHRTHALPLSGTQWGAADGFPVNAVQWFPFDTGLFVTGSMSTTVRCWDTNALAVATEFKLDEPVYGAALSPVATTHTLIAAATRSPHIRLCDMASGAFSHTLIGHRSGTDVWSVCWSPVSEYELVSGGTDGTIRVWDIRRSGTMQHRVLDQFNTAKSAATASKQPSLSGANASAFAAASASASASASATASATATGKSGSTGALKGRGGSGSGSGSGTGISSSTPSTSGALSHSGSVSHLQYSSDGRWLYSSGTDSRLRRWDLAGGVSGGGATNTLVNYVGTTNAHRINRFCLAPHTNRYLFYPNGARVRVYDVVTGEPVRELGASSAAAAPAVGDGGVPGPGASHRDRVMCVTHHPQHEELYSGGADATILVWSPKQWAAQSVIAPSASAAAGAGDDDFPATDFATDT